MGLTVDTNIGADVDLFGKYIADLQSDVVVGDDAITGTLNWISDYTGFSGDVSLQSGNYIGIHCSVPDVDDVTITVTVTNPSVLDADGIVVCRIADKDSQTITVVASKDGCESVTKTFALTGLVCEEEPTNGEPNDDNQETLGG